MGMHSEREIALWVVKYLQGALSEEEKRLLDAWRNESARHEQTFQRYVSGNFYKEMSRLYIPGEEDALLRAVRRRMGHRRRVIRRRWVTWSAAASLLLLLGWGTLRFFLHESSEEAWQSQIALEQIRPGSHQAVLYLSDGQTQELAASAQVLPVNGQPGRWVTDGSRLTVPVLSAEAAGVEGLNRIEVPRGGEYSLLLADRTQVQLNSESELHFPTFFGEETREVAFRGEGYFRVARTETECPFIIRTRMGRIEVRGTAFNLRCYDASELLQLTLEEGSVCFTTSDGRRNCRLEPGELLVYSLRDGSLSIRPVATHLYTSWKDGIYSLEQTPLEQIAEELSRWYDVPMVFDSEELRHITFTGELKRYENFGEVMQLLELTKRIRFRMKGNLIHIMKE